MCFQRDEKRAPAFTLLELLMVLAVMVFIAAIAFPALIAARNRSRMIQCQTNLRSIMAGLQLYGDSFNAFPGQEADLPSLLSASVPAASFRCPDDDQSSADSYSEFYISRRQRDPDRSLILTCPRHFSHKRAINLYLDASQSTAELLRIVQAASGGDEEVHPGQTTTGVDLDFGNAGSVTIDSGAPILAPLAYRMSDTGSAYIFIRAPSSSLGVFTVAASKNATIETVTYTGITRAESSTARISLSLRISGGISFYDNSVEATSGTTRFTPIGGAYLTSLPNGFAVTKQNDHAYVPVTVPEGKKVTGTLEE